MFNKIHSRDTATTQSLRESINQPSSAFTLFCYILAFHFFAIFFSILFFHFSFALLVSIHHFNPFSSEITILFCGDAGVERFQIELHYKVVWRKTQRAVSLSFNIRYHGFLCIPTGLYTVFISQGIFHTGLYRVSVQNLRNCCNCIALIN